MNPLGVFFIVGGLIAWIALVVWLVQRFLMPQQPASVSAHGQAPNSIDDKSEFAFELPDEIERESFKGEWEQKFWMNIPGPFYSTTDNELTSPTAHLAPGYITEGGTDGDEHQFFWRQPVTENARFYCLHAMKSDETSSYQIDGDQHWTPELVRDWWSVERPRIVEWAEFELETILSHRATDGYNPTREGSLHVLLRYLNEDAEAYLRRYIFFLSSGLMPQPGDALPELVVHA